MIRRTCSPKLLFTIAIELTFDMFLLRGLGLKIALSDQKNMFSDITVYKCETFDMFLLGSCV